MSTHASSSSAPPPPLPGPSTAPPSLSPTLPSSTSSQSHPSPPMASPSQYSPETRRQIAESRTALEASMANIGSSLDHTLRSRAENLHSNSKQLDKQQKDVINATSALHKESEKLRKLADEGSKKIKELGNVQNWAEMLERDFLVLGETLRLANLPSDEEWESTEGSSASESDDEERMKRFVYGEHKFVPEDSPRVESPAVDSPRVDSPMVLDAEGDTAMAMESNTGGRLEEQKLEVQHEEVMIRPTIVAEESLATNVADSTKEDKGKSKEVEMQDVMDTDQQKEVIGEPATTATVSMAADPSTHSAHTAVPVLS